MTSNWATKRVGDLQNEEVLRVEDGNHGEYRPRRDEFSSDGTAFIRAANVVHGTIDFENADRISDTALNRLRKGIGRSQDILLTHKGTVGRVARVPRDSPPFVCSPQTTFWRVLDESQIDRDYLFAYLRSPAFAQQLYARMHGSDMASYVSLTEQKALFVHLPPLDQQHAIGGILGRLDAKIEINRRLARTLEDIAATEFKARFVDFVGSDDLIDTMIGSIPRGWEVGCVGDVCRLEYGKALPAKRRNAGEVVVVGSGGIAGSHDECLYEGPGIVLGRKGTAGSVLWVSGDFFPIDTTFVALGKEGVPLLYLLHALRQANFPHIVADSAVPGLNRNAAYARKLPIPPFDEMEAFETVASPCYRLRDQLLTTAATIEALRDQLLPRLVSGEIRVPSKGQSGQEPT